MRAKKLKIIKQQHKVDISISHLEGADYVNILSHHNEKTIIWVHGSKSHDRNISGVVGWIRKQILIPFLYKRADKIVAVSHGILEELISEFFIPAAKITSIFNGLDIAAILNQADESAPEEHMELFRNYFVIITHCRLAAQKNIPALIKIIAAMKDKNEVKWVILGDGELRSELLDLCDSYGVAKYAIWNDQPWTFDRQVYFLGYNKNPFPYLKASNLYVLTSDWEGLPLALAEALVCNLPIISSDCNTGPREILAPGMNNNDSITYPYEAQYGILMPVIANDNSRVTLWKEQILALLSSPLLVKYKDSSFERASYFTQEKANDLTVDLIKSL